MLLEEHLAKAKTNCKPEDIEIYTVQDLEIAQAECARARSEAWRIINEERAAAQKYIDEISKISKKIINAYVWTNTEKLQRKMDDLQEKDRIYRERSDRKYDEASQKWGQLEDRIKIVKDSLSRRGLL
ncbi:hypothetical protein [Sansalvadorimonas verongulae]|uniref:hypothetical protein n=1 Tax=Sansalvadorimonas verongulae TaxID=2172824 RepID=UPI0012BD544F|nr:hypothetical protein [Sansalvadorimonas verongulae]MTI12269.1 hypothetical protein [Sansalvadorimonas verongulae]